MSTQPSLAVHREASSLTKDHYCQFKIDEVKVAAKYRFQMPLNVEDALTSMDIAVMILENILYFNAGAILSFIVSETKSVFQITVLPNGYCYSVARDLSCEILAVQLLKRDSEWLRMSIEPVLAVHGGASLISEHLWQFKIDGVKEAAKLGYQVLKNGGTAVDAAEVAVTFLEDNPYFNAGKGACLTNDGQVELDALIMEGQHMRAGAVGAVKNISNPIKLARKVLQHTPHILFVGEGATKLAADHGIDYVAPGSLVTAESQRRLDHYKRFDNTVNHNFTKLKDDHDTVGCVAFDRKGHVACGTSTGGLTAQIPGRVGDTPLIGSGGIADDEVGAISTTGHGESIARICLAKTILTYMATGESVTSSTKASLDFMERRIQGYAGAIGVSSKGDVGFGFSTKHMAWAYIKEGKLHYGLHRNQHEIEVLS